MTLGEIRLFAFGKAPHGWHLCDGQQLNVREYQALYSLLSNTYGGNGVKTFNLPDLRGVTPVHQRTDKAGAPKMPVGMRGGIAQVSLGLEEMPGHVHALRASAATAAAIPPAGNFLAAKATTTTSSTPHRIYAEGDSDMVTLDSSTLSLTGGGAAHDNMQPYLALNYCICIQGDYPVRPID